MTSRRFTRAAATPAVLFALALLSGCGGSDQPADSSSADKTAAAKPAAATTAPPAGRIAFRRWLDDAKTHGAIFTVRTDGTGEQQLTHPDSGADDYPDWSPDGRMIAYQHCAEGQPCSVWTIDADGGTPHKIRFRCRLKGDCDASGPGWTPDGRLLVTLAQGRVKTFGGVPQIQQSSIEAIDLRSGRQQTIYKRDGWAGDAIDPQAAPYGRAVIYTRLNSARAKPSFGSAIFAIGIDGSNHRQVASWELGGGDHPVFAPSGSILFRSFEGDDSKQSDYWTVRPDGSRLTQLTHFEPGTLVTSASYSLDGKWIVHGSDGDGGADLYLMRADGTDNRPLTRTEWWDSAPDWEPTPR
jgi:Tol biopolymer transport system component